MRQPQQTVQQLYVHYFAYIGASLTDYPAALSVLSWLLRESTLTDYPTALCVLSWLSRETTSTDCPAALSVYPCTSLTLREINLDMLPSSSLFTSVWQGGWFALTGSLLHSSLIFKDRKFTHLMSPEICTRKKFPVWSIPLNSVERFLFWSIPLNSVEYFLFWSIPLHAGEYCPIWSIPLHTILQFLVWSIPLHLSSIEILSQVEAHQICMIATYWLRNKKIFFNRNEDTVVHEGSCFSSLRASSWLGKRLSLSPANTKTGVLICAWKGKRIRLECEFPAYVCSTCVIAVALSISCKCAMHLYMNTRLLAHLGSPA